MTTDKNNDLPTLDDFTESSLLDTIESEEEEQEQEEQEDEHEKEEEDPKPKKKPVGKKPLLDEDEDEDEKDSEEEEEEEEPKKKPKAKTEAQDKEGEEEEDDSTDTFWNDVEQITGVNVEVDYGDVDPESPEGAAMREAALVEKVETGIWEFIQKNHPKVYKALELESAGGDIADIITPDYIDYSKVELDPENDSQHKKILLDYYMDVNKLSEAKARRMVEADEDSEEEDGLFKAAQEALKERQKLQEERETALVEKQKKEAQKQQAQDAQVVDYVKSITDQGKIGNFNLPKAERQQFFEYFVSTIQRNPNGGYMFATPLGNDNFDQIMEQAYFSFKGGKLDQLVERRAITQSAKRLKKTLKRSDSKRTKGASDTDANREERENRKRLPTMDSFSAE